MDTQEKPKLTMAPGQDLTLVALSIVLKGITITMEMDDGNGGTKTMVGCPHLLEFAPGNEFLFANVQFKNIADSEDEITRRISITPSTGVVHLMPE